jgi:hypothetical protein
LLLICVQYQTECVESIKILNTPSCHVDMCRTIMSRPELLTASKLFYFIYTHIERQTVGQILCFLPFIEDTFGVQMTLLEDACCDWR